MGDPPLAASYVGLATFLAAIALCVFPLRIPIWRTVSLPVDIGTAPPLAVCFLLAIRVIGVDELRSGFLGDGRIQPFGIVLLIFSLAAISISIDVSGAFGWLALKMARSSGDSGRGLWMNLYLLSAVVATFFSNDVVVLTLTPIALYFLEVVKVDPNPFLLPSFQVANLASMFLVLGNPTNIVVAQGTGLSFLAFSAWTALPTLAAVVVANLVLFLFFRKEIPRVVDASRLEQFSDHPRFTIHDRFGAAFGCFCMVGCLATLLAVSVFDKGVNVALLAGPWAVAVLIGDGVRDVFVWRRGRTVTVTAPRSNVEMEQIPLTVGEGNGAVREGSADKGHANDRAHDGRNGVDVETARTEVVHEIRPRPGQRAEESPDNFFSEDSSTESLHPTVHSPPDHSTDPHLSPTVATQPPSIDPSTPPSTTSTLLAVLSRLPWKIAPFSIALFILVESLETLGWTARFATVASFIVPDFPTAVFAIGVVATVLCNVTCNLPMTILMVRVLDHPNCFPGTVTGAVEIASREAAKTGALWGVVIGSNLGGNVTPLGALAGLMWLQILKRFQKVVPWRTFIYYGLVVTIPVLAVSLAVLSAEMAVMYAYVWLSAVQRS